MDETVFHQILHWHHFYDKSTPDVGLVSEGRRLERNRRALPAISATVD